ncbi:MAG: alpha/beta fold hydrolase [Myxococcaceae bacterium]
MSSPHTPALSWVQGKAGRLRVEASGSGPRPVLLLHGNGGDRTHWAQTLPHLARAHRAVAFDLRGMGESDAPGEGGYALDDMVEDVVRVAEALGLGRFVLVGHSFGASVVAAACRRIPERLLGALFLDGAGDVRGLPPEQLQAWRASMAPERFAVSVREWFLQLLAPATPETRVRVLATLAHTPRAAYVGAMEQLFAFDPAQAIGCFGGPKALLAVRSLDGPLSLRLAVPELPCEFFDDVSHWLQLDRPDSVNSALDRFLASLPSE